LIIWRGWGFLVAVIVLVALIAMELVASALQGEGAYQEETALWAGIGLLLAGAVIYPLGRRLNGGEGRLMVDKQTGQEVLIKPIHSLFFIRMEYWGLAALAGGVISIVIGLVT
jgi:cytochrome b561